MATAVQFLVPEWPAPDNIVSVSSCRGGGVSLAPYNSLNLGRHTGDDKEAVDENRRRLLRACDGLEHIQWLQQVHGAELACLTEIGDIAARQQLTADASYTELEGLACAVMTADCLPVLFCSRDGEKIAAAHAGWRGLLAGVLENTVNQFAVDPAEILVWLGPAISQQFFEVGPEVRQGFLAKACNEQQRNMIDGAFQPTLKHNNHFFADLYQLASIRLKQVGVSDIYGAEYCTYGDKQRFYSFRRDGETGRMASLIYKR